MEIFKSLCFLFFLQERTSCGSMVMNDAIVHLSVETLPFGGVGASGMGAYHGRYTFLTFSHAKSILVRGFGALGTVPYINSLIFSKITKFGK
jgi:hypothetical protein